jgi:hypothetical protein
VHGIAEQHRLIIAQMVQQVLVSLDVNGGENPRINGDGGASVNLAVSLPPVCVERAAVLVAVKDASRREGAVAFGHP